MTAYSFKSNLTALRNLPLRRLPAREALALLLRDPRYRDADEQPRDTRWIIDPRVGHRGRAVLH